MPEVPIFGPFPQLSTMVVMMIFTMMALGLNFVVGYAGLLDLGYVAFYALGAYMAGWFASSQFASRNFHLGAVGVGPDFPGFHLSIWLILPLAGFATALVGVLIGLPTLRLRGDYLAIVTLGFGEIIRVFILNIDAVGGARGYAGIPKLANFFWIYAFAALTILIVYRIVHSSFGRTLVAIREDEIAAEAMGVHTTRAKVISFVVSSALAGVAGGLFAHYLMYINTNSFTFLKSFEIIIMIVIGGLGSISGSVLGAVLFISLTEGLREFAQYRMVLFSLLLVVLMIVRPQGILGHKEFVTFLTRRRRSIGAAPGTTGNA